MGNKKDRKKGKTRPEKKLDRWAVTPERMIGATLPNLSGDRKAVRITLPESVEGKGPPRGFVFVTGASAREVAEACIGRGLGVWGHDHVRVDEVELMTLEDFRAKHPSRTD